MRIIFLVFLLFFSVINITNAIPVPAFVLWYDFMLFLVPFVIWIFSIVVFYFKRYIFHINIFLFFVSIFFYYIHYSVTGDIFFYEKEYLFFQVILVIFLLIFLSKYWTFNRLQFLNYILFFVLIWVFLFLWKTDYNLYKFKQFYNRILDNISPEIIIQNVKYKDNFVIIYWLDRVNKTEAYVSIENWLFGNWYYLSKWKYYIVFWGDELLWIKLSDLVYEQIY